MKIYEWQTSHGLVSQAQVILSLNELWLALTLDRVKCISISASLFPTHPRTPTPNGMKLYGWCR